MADISVDDIEAEIGRLLRDYGADVTKQLEDDVEEAALEARDELRQTSPKEHGKYARSWETDWASDGDGDSHMVVHNVAGGRKSGKRKLPTNITALLEKGHASREIGGWVAGDEHIAPAADTAFKSLERRLRNG